MRGVNYGMIVGDDYREFVKKIMFVRYYEMDFWWNIDVRVIVYVYYIGSLCMDVFKRNWEM